MANFEELYPSTAKQAEQEDSYGPPEPGLVTIDGGVRPDGEDFDTEYYTVDEVAAVLRVHRITVYRMIKEGQLKADKLRKMYRIRKSDLRSLMSPEESK